MGILIRHCCLTKGQQLQYNYEEESVRLQHYRPCWDPDKRSALGCAACDGEERRRRC
jgi:hypothetical protein